MTPAEHVLREQAITRSLEPRTVNVIDRAWGAVLAWLAKAYAPWPSSRAIVVYVWRKRRVPRTVARRLVPFGLVLVAVLPMAAVEAGVWRVGS